jgi:hypothetical protein
MSDSNPLDRSQSRAVLIGTSKYKELSQVGAAANSLESMYRLLTGQLCGWSAEQVTRIADPQETGNLPDRLVELFGQAKDVALFYYVGHGQVDFEDQLCLGLVGSRLQSERRATTSLTFEAVRRALRASPAATKVVILDCCFAGHAVQSGNTLSGAEEVDIAGLTGTSGAYTLAATGPDNTAWFEADTENPVPQTHFTRALVDVVTRGISDASDVLTLEPIYHRLRIVLPSAGKPIPTRVSRHNADSFIFARNAAFRPPPALNSPPIRPPENLAERQRLLDLAEESARSITELSAQYHVLIEISKESAKDDGDRARRLWDEIDQVIGTIKDFEAQARLWSHLTEASEATDPPRARKYLAAFERVVTDSKIPNENRDRFLRPGDLRFSIFLLDFDTVERIARTITDQDSRRRFISRAILEIAKRDPNYAEHLARLIRDDSGEYGTALFYVARAVRDHDPDRAEKIARSISNIRTKCETLAGLAGSIAPYDLDRARKLIGEAQSLADRAGNAEDIDYCRADIVEALARSLRNRQPGSSDAASDWAQEIAWRVTKKITSNEKAAYAAIDIAASISGKPTDVKEMLNFAVRKHERTNNRLEKADTTHIQRDVVYEMLAIDVRRAIAIAKAMDLDGQRDAALLRIIQSISETDPDQAELLAYHVARPKDRAHALSRAAAGMATRNPDYAMSLLQHARATARAVGWNAPGEVAKDIATFDLDLALTILNEDSDPRFLGDGLTEIAKAVMGNAPQRAADIEGYSRAPFVTPYLSGTAAFLNREWPVS